MRSADLVLLLNKVLSRCDLFHALAMHSADLALYVKKYLQADNGINQQNLFCHDYLNENFGYFYCNLQ